jgi:hypothetical protein
MGALPPRAKVTIDAKGNLGIGVTSPNYNLRIYDDVIDECAKELVLKIDDEILGSISFFTEHNQNEKE